MTDLDEITEGIYRISTVDERTGFSFNQFVIKDDGATLIHTGSSQMFPDTLNAVQRVIGLSELRHIFVSHFESDECGALAKFLAHFPDAVTVCSAVCARQLSGFDICRSAKSMQPGDVLELGARKLRFLSYPSEPHLWEGLLAYEEKGRVLFSADLFVQRGKVEGPVVKTNRNDILQISPQAIPSEEGREKCLAGIKELAIDIIAVGHGPSFNLRS